MLWWIILMSMFLCIQVLLNKVHPIRLAAVTLLMGVVSSVSLSFFVGPLFAVVHFLVLLGGILVVFAFSVALVPMKLKKKVSSTNYMGFPHKALYKFLFIFLLLVGCFSELGSMFFPFLYYSDCSYFSLSWGKYIVVLSLYLLISMIAAADISKCQKGALIR